MRNNQIIKAALARTISLLLILCMLTSNLAGAIVFAVTEEESENISNLVEEPISEATPSDEEMDSAEPDSASPIEDATPADSEGSVTATLYDEGSNAGKPVVFTKDGKNGDVPLKHSLSRGNNLLVINWEFNVKEAHTLTITVPSGIYIDSGTWSPVGQTGSLLTNVSFKSLDTNSSTSGLQQGVGKYSNSKTGTLTYTTAAIANADYIQKETIVLYIGFDEALWSKTKDDKIREKEELSIGEDPAVDISVDGTVSACLQEIYAGQDGGGIHTWHRSFPDQGVVSITTNNGTQSPFGFTIYDSEQNSNACWAVQKVSTKFEIVVLDSQKNIRHDITISVTGAHIREDKKTLVRSSEEFDLTNQTFIVTDPNRVKNSKAFYYVLPEFMVTESTRLNEGDIVRIIATNTITFYNGTQVEIQAKDEKGLVDLTYYPNKPVLDFTLVNNEQNKYTQLQFDRNYVEMLGSISLSNKGFAAAENVKITAIFDTDYDPDSGVLPDVLVSAYRIPLPKDEKTTVTAYTISADGIPQDPLTFETPKNTGSNQYSSVLISVGPGKYIYKIEYTLSSIPAQSILCDTGGTANLDSTGHIYGLVRNTTEALLTYSYELDGETKTGKGTIEIKAVESRGTASLLILEPNENFTVTAGRNDTMTVKISAATDQNASATFLSNPVIFFVAPKGVTVEGVMSGYSATTMTDIGHVTPKRLRLMALRSMCWS